MDSGRSASGIISILTDFGTSDGYVAAMKGVILGINRSATIVDVSHEVRAQGVLEGAFILHTVCRHFPPGTVHLAVVDPGVGTDRAGVAVDTGDAVYVGPDNGLLSFVLAGQGERANHGRPEGKRKQDEQDGKDRQDRDNEDLDPRFRGDDGGMGGDKPPPYGTAQAQGTQSSALSPQSLTHHSLPPGWRAVRLAEPRFWLPEISHTFHGRDVFAPVVAHLSMGEPLGNLGPEIDRLLSFPIPEVARLVGGAVTGAVVHVDRFGNLITNLRRSDLPSGPADVEVGGERIVGLSRTYAEAAGLAALVGSSGYLEIALPGGSAHAATGLGTGAEVRVVPAARRPI